MLTLDKLGKTALSCSVLLNKIALICCCLSVVMLISFYPTNTTAAISNVPLFVTYAARANILVVLDNSNSMDEAANGSAVGSFSANSKSEIARNIIRQLTSDYQQKINMGLMSYRLNNTSAWQIHNSPYDVSYDPANYNSAFTGNRSSTTKKFMQTISGTDVYYNVALPFYSSGNEGTGFCYSATADASANVNYPDGFHNNETLAGPWDTYQCFSTKTGTSDAAPPGNGYDGPFFNGQLSPTDSDFAQGLFDFGKRLVWYHVGPTWYVNSSPGRGFLHTPINLLDATQATALDERLKCNVPNPGTGLGVNCANTGIRNAGLTPIEGTLLTAKDYYKGTWTNAAEGYSASVYPLPESCGKNFVILVTDGLPSTDKDGNVVTNPATAIAQAASAAAALKADNVETYVVGFALPYGTDPSTLNTIAASGGTNTAYFANDSATLKAALDTIFLDIEFKTGTAAAIATNSTQLNTGTLIYQAKFDSSDWSGQLVAYKVNADGTVDTVNPASKVWDTDDSGKIPAHGSRKIFTWNGTGSPVVKGVEFKVSEWSNLDAGQQAALQAGGTATDGQNRIDWLRGDQSNEVAPPPATMDPTKFRRRTKILGDIVNSDPHFVADPNFGYEELPTGTPGKTTYFAFRNANKTRTKTLYVGANDGMLHAFDALTGVEKFAYVPKAVFPNLASLTAVNYAHKYFVDGSPYAGDAYFGGAWHTVLLGSTGAGGRAIFALDITDPDSFDQAKVLWEFTDPDLGYTIGQPVIGRMKDGTWAAIFGNGYESDNRRAFLFVVNLETGALIRKIDTGAGSAGSPNGLAAPALLADNTRTIEYAYGGDLLGNIWKFDLTSATASNWAVAYNDGVSPTPNPAPLFKARYVSGSPSTETIQPITAPLEIGAHPNGGYIIAFGTGKYFEVGDNGSTAVQSLYGIWDNGTRIAQTDRSTLVQQAILSEQTVNTLKWRVVAANSVAWASKRGWYIDLIPPGSSAAGERVVSTPILRGGRAIFTTLIPSFNPCDAGGTSWIMEQDLLNGGRLAYSVFDVNKDTRFTTADNVTITVAGVDVSVPVSGIQSTVGIIKTPAVISAGEVEYKFAGGSTGGIMNVPEKGASGGGRQSWRQLR